MKDFFLIQKICQLRQFGIPFYFLPPMIVESYLSWGLTLSLFDKKGALHVFENNLVQQIVALKILVIYFESLVYKTLKSGNCHSKKVFNWV